MSTDCKAWTICPCAHNTLAWMSRLDLPLRYDYMLPGKAYMAQLARLPRQQAGVRLVVSSMRNCCWQFAKLISTAAGRKCKCKVLHHMCRGSSDACGYIFKLIVSQSGQCWSGECCCRHMENLRHLLFKACMHCRGSARS